jgi:uncharacterized protein YegP (UPF0339 family)
MVEVVWAILYVSKETSENAVQSLRVPRATVVMASGLFRIVWCEKEKPEAGPPHTRLGITRMVEVVWAILYVSKETSESAVQSLRVPRATVVMASGLFRIVWCGIKSQRLEHPHSSHYLQGW